jgi:hypothetical protein
MKRALLALSILWTLSAHAQVTSPFTFYVHDTTGVVPDFVLPPNYQMPDAAVGSSSSIVLKIVNSSSNNVYFVAGEVSPNPDTPFIDFDYSISGSSQNVTFAPGGSTLFTVTFNPTTSGPITGYLEVLFEEQTNGCSFFATDPSLQCASNFLNVSTLTGDTNSASVQLTLSYQSASGSVTVQPSNTTPVSFPSTVVSATNTITFTLTNPASTSVTVPTISLAQSGSSGFGLDVSSVPTTLTAGQTATFNVTFSPSQAGAATNTIVVGSNSYAIAGTGVVAATVGALQVSYANASGTQTTAQTGTPISLPQVTPGNGASTELAFTVTNPSTASGSVSIPSISVSGATFSLSGVPAAPIVVAVGGSISFNVVFQPTTTGTFTGTLSIGSQQYSLTALGATVTLPFTFYVHDTTGTAADTPLPANYQLSSTAVGNASPLVLKMVNTSQSTVYFATAVMSTSATSSAANPNFSVTGLFEDETLAPGGDVLFTVNFTPSVTGAIIGYLNVAFQIQTGTCQFTSNNAAQQCPSNFLNVGTFTGTATAPQLVLSYQSSTGATTLQPSSASPLNFPNTSVSSTSSITFTLTNPTGVSATTPSISLQSVNTNAPSAFSIDTSSVPTTIAAGQSANFTITFAPGQVALASSNLLVGANTYPIQGEGIVSSCIDGLIIQYTDTTGVRTSPQAATPITFPQVVPGSGASSLLAFTITNPSTAACDAPVTIPGITVTGSGFSLTSVPAAPITVSLGGTISFNLVFEPTSTGTFTGTLAIGGREFSLSALGVASPLPGFSIKLAAPIASQQQASLTVEFSSPSTVAALGTITLQFVPSVANVSDDAAIFFVATSGRQLNLAVASGAQTATYNGQSAITFQTGTTAGTITFSVAFPDTTTYTQSFTITPETVKISSVEANRESPNLLVTVTGFDNTYSASQFSFTFSDTTGKTIGTPITVNEAANFQTLFFTNNTEGGIFSLQASFPVTGDVTQVGSVSVAVTNSAGQSAGTATFQ